MKQKRHEDAIERAVNCFQEFKAKQGDNGFTFAQATTLIKKHRISPDRLYGGIATGYIVKNVVDGTKRYKYSAQDVNPGQIKKMIAYTNKKAAKSVASKRSGTPVVVKKETPPADEATRLINRLKELGYTGELKRVVSVVL